MSEREITTHYDRGRRPAVNIKIYPPNNWSELLPLELGQVADLLPDGTTGEPRTFTTEPGFTWAWVEANVSESAQDSWWQATCEDHFQQARDLAEDIFGPKVSVWQEGRSGGWLVVDGLPEDTDEWPEELRTNWFRFEEDVKALVADVPRGFLWNLHANVYEPRLESYSTTVPVNLTIDPEAYALAYGEEATHAAMEEYARRLVHEIAANATKPEWLTIESEEQ